MVYNDFPELKEKQTKLLAELRSIIGNKKFEFPKSYIDRRKGEHYLNDNTMPYYGVTRQSVICPCRVVYALSKDCAEYGAVIMKYSVYKYYDGTNVKKIPLEDLYVKDLEKIVNDIKFFLYWESDVHFPEIKKEYEQTLEYVKKYNKLLNKS